MKATVLDMTEGPLLGKIIRYTIPIILTGVLQLLFNAADLVVVGQYRGSESVAAVGNTGAITNLIINLFIGLSVGAGVTVAHNLGAKKDDAVRDTVHTAMPAAAISGVFLTLVGVLIARPVLTLMGPPADVLDRSAMYMQIYFCGMTGSMIYNFGAAILRAAGDTKSPLVYLTVAGVLNIFLNVFFVAVCGRDVDGVALATILSQAVSAVLVVRALMRRTDACRLSLKRMRIQKRPLTRMMVIGIPAGIQGSLFSISNVIIQSSVNSFGSVVMAGNAAAGNIEGFVYTSMNSFQQTALNFIGQNMGAGKLDRVKRIMLICLACVTVDGLLFGTSAWAFGDKLLPIYLKADETQAEAVAYGLIRMTYICLPYFFCGLMDVMTGTLRGMGSSYVPMAVTILGVCVFRIVWIYTVFAHDRTLETLYVSYVISWALTVAVEVVCFVFLMRRQRRATRLVKSEQLRKIFRKRKINLNKREKPPRRFFFLSL